MPRIDRPQRRPDVAAVAVPTAAAELAVADILATAPVLCVCGCDRQAVPNVDRIVIVDGRPFLAAHWPFRAGGEA